MAVLLSLHIVGQPSPISSAILCHGLKPGIEIEIQATGKVATDEPLSL